MKWIEEELIIDEEKLKRMSEFTERLSGTVPPNGDKEVNVNGATKSPFMHYSCVVIYFFKTHGFI